MTHAPDEEFLTASAVTRSLLGWGVVAGPAYLTVGLVLALTRDGFDLASHQLSLLMLGDDGWIQSLNLVLTGIMVLAAGWGIGRVTGGERAGRVGAALVALFGLGLVGSGIFPPDPMAGFPPGSTENQVSASGLLHLVFGAIEFASVAGACFALARWARGRKLEGLRRLSIASGIVILTGFIGGAALSALAVGVLLLWIAVLVSFGWLARTCTLLWREVPHPDPERRLARS